MRWDSNKDIIWGLLSWCSASHYNFFSYDYNTKKLEKYNIPKGCNYDYDINPNPGLLLYSDYPFIVDADSEKDLISSKTKIHLYVLNFRTNKTTLIKTSIGKEFNPKWITNEIVEYNLSATNKRETIKVKK